MQNIINFDDVAKGIVKENSPNGCKFLIIHTEYQ